METIPNTGILLADLVEPLRGRLQLSLFELGYGVFSSSSFSRAIELVRTESVRIALLADLEADRVALELLRQLRLEHSELECILLLDHPSKEYRLEALRLDVVSFLSPPHDLCVAIDAVQQAAVRLHDGRRTQKRLASNHFGFPHRWTQPAHD